MKKLILGTVLTLVSLQAKLSAQTDREKKIMMSKTEQTFNNPSIINIRDFVVLKDGGKMIVELAGPEDYKALENMDSLLNVFMKDISFYKDSLAADPTANYRIDYVLNDEYSYKKIRFKKHKADGDIYMSRDGEIAKLKFEQDTVRLIIQKSMPGLVRGAHGPCTVYYNAQVTFLLGNYYDVNRVIANKELGGIIETLEKASKPKKDTRLYMLTHPITIVYNPYYNGPGNQLTRHDFLMDNEYSLSNYYDKHKFTFNPQIGAGVVRNTLAPVADIGIQYNEYWNNYKQRSIFRLSATGYYFFDKDDKGNFLVNDNWFINGTIGSIYDHTDRTWIGKETTFGAGYLVSEKGGYFKNSTFRVFTDIMFVKGVTIVPELIFTNNCKQIFPGITLKIF